MGLGLIFAGEIEVDVRHLVAAEAQEGLKGDAEALLGKLCSAFRAAGVGQIRAAGGMGLGPLRPLDLRAVAGILVDGADLGAVEGGEFTVGIRAAIVGREGIDLRNAG